MASQEAIFHFQRQPLNKNKDIRMSLQRFPKIILAMLILPAILLLGGCATITMKPLSPAAQSETNGYVTVTLITNSNFITQLVAGFDTITLKSVSSKDTFYLKNQATGTDSKQIFAGWIPAGEYLISSIGSPAGTASINTESTFKKFTVQKGDLTDLQTIIYQPIGNAESIVYAIEAPTNSGTTALPDHQASTSFLTQSGRIKRQSLSQDFPSLPIKIQANSAASQGIIVAAMMSIAENSSKTKKQQRWQSATNSKEMLALSKTSTQTLRSAQIAENGNSLYGSKLGQILSRSSTGEWTYIDTGETGEITSLYAENNGSRILAGTEDGSLKVSDDAGKSWRLATDIKSNGSVVFVTGLGKDRYFMATRSSLSKISAYQIALDTSPAITHMRDIELSTNNFWTVQPGNLPITNILRASGSIFFAMDASKILAYDIQQDSWRDIKTPDNFQLLRKDNSGKNILLVDVFGLTRNHFISSDSGRTWKKISAPHMAVDLHFSNENDGYGLVLDIGVFSSTTKTITTHDGGRTWATSPPMPEGCTNFFVVDSTKEILCSTRSGLLLSSANGNGWKTERSAD